MHDRPPNSSPDSVLLGEVLATIEAAADMCVAAASPGVHVDEAWRLRRTVRAQLDICARLVFEVKRANAIMVSTAAAAGRSSETTPAAAVTDLRGGSMSRYDQPGFAGEIPGLGAVDAGSLSNAPGSNGAERPAAGGGQLGQVAATRPFDSVQEPGTIAMATQGYGSTAPGSNDPNFEKISGVTSPTSDAGHVCGPSHPNAGK